MTALVVGPSPSQASEVTQAELDAALVRVTALEATDAARAPMVHVQTTAANPWVIVHGRAEQPTSVEVELTDGRRVLAGVIRSTPGQTSITFATDNAGRARLGWS